MSLGEGSEERRLCAARLAAWSASVPSGMALVTSSDIGANLNVIVLLEELLSSPSNPLTHIELPWNEDPLQAPNGLLNSLRSVPHGTVAVTALMVAFRTTSDTANAIRVLNSMRDVLAGLPLKQIWFCPQVLVQSFRQLAPDLMRWFLVNETLGDYRPRDYYSDLLRSIENPQQPISGALRTRVEVVLEWSSLQHEPETFCETEAKAKAIIMRDSFQNAEDGQSAELPPGTELPTGQVLEALVNQGRHKDVVILADQATSVLDERQVLAISESMMEIGMCRRALVLLERTQGLAWASDYNRMTFLNQCFGCHFAVSPEEVSQDKLNDLIIAAMTVENETDRQRWRAHSFSHLLTLYWEEPRSDGLQNVAQMIVEMARSLDKFHSDFELTYLIARAYHFLGKYEVSIAEYSSAFSLLEVSGQGFGPFDRTMLSLGVLCSLARVALDANRGQTLFEAVATSDEIIRSTRRKYPPSNQLSCNEVHIKLTESTFRLRNGQSVLAEGLASEASSTYNRKRRLFGVESPYDQRVLRMAKIAGIPLTPGP